MEQQTIAYLTSEYPAISHTFIFREVQALREQGFHVKTASVARTRHLERMTEAEQADAANTLYIKSSPLLRILGAHCALLFGAPLVYGRMLAKTLAIAFRSPTPVWKAFAYLAEAGVLLHWMKREGARHVHVHFANASTTVAMIAAHGRTITYSVSVHGPDVFDSVDTQLLAEKVRNAQFTRCISHYCRSQLLRLVPFDLWRRFHIVRCGVNVNQFAPRETPSNNPPELLCVGRLVPVKGQHVLLDACRGLRERGVAFHLTYVGDGPDRESLERQCSRLGLEDAVTFAGVVGQGDIHAFYDKADIFVLASFREGLPVVLMEAMAKGIPSVSTRIAGIPELIHDGENGCLLYASDAGGLTECLARLLADAELRERLGKQARETVVQEYDLAKNCTRMGELFRTYLTAGSSPTEPEGSGTP